MHCRCNDSVVITTYHASQRRFLLPRFRETKLSIYNETAENGNKMTRKNKLLWLESTHNWHKNEKHEKNLTRRHLFIAPLLYARCDWQTSKCELSNIIKQENVTTRSVLLKVLTFKIILFSWRHVINNLPCSFVYLSNKQIYLRVFCYRINGYAADKWNLSSLKTSIWLCFYKSLCKIDLKQRPVASVLTTSLTVLHEHV